MKIETPADAEAITIEIVFAYSTFSAKVKVSYKMDCNMREFHAP